MANGRLKATAIDVSNVWFGCMFNETSSILTPYCLNKDGRLFIWGSWVRSGFVGWRTSMDISTSLNKWFKSSWTPNATLKTESSISFRSFGLKIQSINLGSVLARVGSSAKSIWRSNTSSSWSLISLTTRFDIVRVARRDSPKANWSWTIGTDKWTRTGIFIRTDVAAISDEPSVNLKSTWLSAKWFPEPKSKVILFETIEEMSSGVFAIIRSRIWVIWSRLFDKIEETGRTAWTWSKILSADSGELPNWIFWIENRSEPFSFKIDEMYEPSFLPVETSFAIVNWPWLMDSFSEPIERSRSKTETNGSWSKNRLAAICPISTLQSKSKTRGSVETILVLISRLDSIDRSKSSSILTSNWLTASVTFETIAFVSMIESSSGILSASSIWRPENKRIGDASEAPTRIEETFKDEIESIDPFKRSSTSFFMTGMKATSFDKESRASVAIRVLSALREDPASNSSRERSGNEFSDTWVDKYPHLIEIGNGRTADKLASTSIWDSSLVLV